MKDSVVMRSRFTASMGLVVFLLASCAQGAGQRAAVAPSVSCRAASSLAATQATAIVYATGADGVRPSDLWLFDVSSNRTKRLMGGVEGSRKALPRFIDAARISFVTSDDNNEYGVFYEMSLDRGRAREVFSTGRARIEAYDWSSDGKKVVYFAVDRQSSMVGIYSLADRATRVVRRFPPLEGRDRLEKDDLSVSWSPGGQTVLLTSTAFDTFGLPADERDASIFVLQEDGKEVRPPWAGTYARWSGDGCHVYFRTYREPVTWSTRDLRDGSSTRLRTDGEKVRPSVSPDGRLLALDDSRSIYVYDVASGVERVLASGRVGALWLTWDRLAAMNVRPCTENDECYPARNWKGTGAATAFTISTGGSTPLVLGSTFDADVLYR